MGVGRGYSSSIIGNVNNIHRGWPGPRVERTTSHFTSTNGVSKLKKRGFSGLFCSGEKGPSRRRRFQARVSPPALALPYCTHPLTSHRIDIAAHVPTACLGHLPSHALPLVRDRWEILRQILQIIMARLCRTQAPTKKTLCTRRALFFSHAWHLARHAPGTRVVILPHGKVGRLNVPQMNW